MTHPSKGRKAIRRERSAQPPAKPTTCLCNSKFAEPTDNPGLERLDQRCIVESQWSASLYDELWRCRVCGKKWRVCVYRDGDVRNQDETGITELPADFPDRLPPEQP